MLSFLTQLDSTLKAETTKGCGSVRARLNPKIELQIANRTKNIQDGYGSVFAWKFLDKPTAQHYCCAHIKVSPKVEICKQPTVWYVKTSSYVLSDPAPRTIVQNNGHRSRSGGERSSGNETVIFCSVMK